MVIRSAFLASCFLFFASTGASSMEPIKKSDAEWKRQLSPEQCHVCRLGGTEPAGSGRYVHTKDKGLYKCSNCGLELFSSDTKFDSGSGWPSFRNPADKKNVRFVEDTSHGMVRTEVRCARCDAHLGHVFEDGPAPTGQRYCINSVSLDLEKAS